MKIVLILFITFTASIVSMEKFDFLKCTTKQQLDEFYLWMNTAAAKKNNLKQLIDIYNEYLRVINLEVSLQGIQMFDHNREEITQKIKLLKTHAAGMTMYMPLMAAALRPAYQKLYHAINTGSYEKAKDLLTAMPADFLHDNPQSLAHMVCFGNWHDDETKTKEILELMLAKGANINQITQYTENQVMQTPLDVACGKGMHGFGPSAYTAPLIIQRMLQQRGARHVQQPAEYPSKDHKDYGHPLYGGMVS